MSSAKVASAKPDITPGVCFVGPGPGLLFFLLSHQSSLLVLPVILFTLPINQSPWLPPFLLALVPSLLVLPVILFT